MPSVRALKREKIIRQRDMNRLNLMGTHRIAKTKRDPESAAFFQEHVYELPLTKNIY